MNGISKFMGNGRFGGWPRSRCRFPTPLRVPPVPRSSGPGIEDSLITVCELRVGVSSQCMKGHRGKNLRAGKDCGQHAAHESVDPARRAIAPTDDEIHFRERARPVHGCPFYSGPLGKNSGVPDHGVTAKTISSVPSEAVPAAIATATIAAVVSPAVAAVAVISPATGTLAPAPT